MNSPCSWIYPQLQKWPNVDEVYRVLNKRYWNPSSVPSAFYWFIRKNPTVSTSVTKDDHLNKQWHVKKLTWMTYRHLTPECKDDSSSLSLFFSPLVLHAFVDPVRRWFWIFNLANQPFDDVIPHSIIYVFCFA